MLKCTTKMLLPTFFIVKIPFATQNHMYSSIFLFCVVYVHPRQCLVLSKITTFHPFTKFFCVHLFFFRCCRLREPPLEIGRISQTFVSSFSSIDLPPKTHDFLRTALITLFLVTVIFVMFLCVLLTAYIVISFT